MPKLPLPGERSLPQVWHDDVRSAVVEKHKSKKRRGTDGMYVDDAGSQAPTFVDAGLPVGEDTYYVMVDGTALPKTETHDLFEALASARSECCRDETGNVEVFRKSDGNALARRAKWSNPAYIDRGED